MTKKNNSTLNTIVEVHYYKNEKGDLLYRIAKYFDEDGRKKFFCSRPKPKNPPDLEHPLDPNDPDDRYHWINELGNDTRMVLYNLQELLRASPDEWVFIVEGEKNVERLRKQGIVATTCAFGARKWNDSYSEFLTHLNKVGVIRDNDEPGKAHGMQVAESLVRVGVKNPKVIDLPGLPEKGDVCDYLDGGGNKKELFKIAEKTAPFRSIDTSQFKPLSPKELTEILGLTIKKDQDSKLITFLCELSAYTEDSQFNISFNAPSSSGKSYIPTEVARLFPQEDIIELGYVSPAAFFHDVSRFDKKRKCYIADLSRKILIFLDQPHNQLLERLRPLLSHDKREINLKIADKSQRFGLRTKNVTLRGYPAVIFCTAKLKIDEQEATRFLLLSPETTQGKIKDAINEKIKKETDPKSYERWLNEIPARKMLKERIHAIKQENIRNIKISSPEKIRERFFNNKELLKPRHTRDIGRLISLIKSFALLNLWLRDRKNSTIWTNEDDIKEAFALWEPISLSQELNLPPYLYRLYDEVIFAAYDEKNRGRAEGFEQATGQLGLSRQDIVQKHCQVYGRPMADWRLRQEILPMLEASGLIFQEKDPNDRRKLLVYPTPPLTTFHSANQGHMEQHSAVTT